MDGESNVEAVKRISRLTLVMRILIPIETALFILIDWNTCVSQRIVARTLLVFIVAALDGYYSTYARELAGAPDGMTELPAGQVTPRKVTAQILRPTSLPYFASLLLLEVLIKKSC